MAVFGALYDLLRYYVIPPLFVLFFTGTTQLLVAIANPFRRTDISSLLNTGTTFSWTVVAVFMVWTFLSLKVPSAIFDGPATPTGYVPRYSANGTQFYFVSLACYLILVYMFPNLPVEIFDNFGDIVSTLNVFSLVFCVFLLIKGRWFPEVSEGALDKPLPYQFYAGIELHPRLFGVDIKQWTNCRMGMMGWALLVLNFSFASIKLNYFQLAPLANSVLINLYLAKFFYWETGYFNTLDITLDRAGYYLCWGCLTWVQVFYTFSAHYLVAYPSEVSDSGALAIFVFGCLALALNYTADYQKQLFKDTNGECVIWGRKAKFVHVEYKSFDGKRKKSKLLLSGFWGLARHMNYLWELLLALSWSLPGVTHGPWTFLYFGFLCVLLVHRTFRDEEKCLGKYGDGWKEYCNKVPYRIVPYIF